ncbi:hypothetical protein MKW92_049284 [Papaver armeniacum]|nr:hypothetical protein MKW92_049284 [Papaver armeniacum]
MEINLKRKDLVESISRPYNHNDKLSDGKTAVPLKSYSSELNRDKKALEAIKMSSGTQMLPHIIHAEFASEAWNWLAKAADAPEEEKDKYNKMVTAAATSRVNLDKVPEADKVLTRRNYGKWKFYMKNVLLSKYLWSVVDESYKIELPAYKMKNHNALVAIRMSCGEEMFNFIFEEDHAYKAWRKLESELGADAVATGIAPSSTAQKIFSDYESWGKFTEHYLETEGLWGFLKESKISDRVKDEKALDAIKLHCPPHMQKFIWYVDCAKSAWEELEAEQDEFEEAYETHNAEHSMRAENIFSDVAEADRVLTRANYGAWSSYMKPYLQSLRLWNTVNSGNDDDTESDKIKNACALKIIKEACGRDMLCYIFYQNSEIKAWNKLKEASDVKRQDEYLRYSQLLHAIQNNIFRVQKQDYSEHWRGADMFFRDFPEALTAEITEDGSTALHIAVRLGRVHFVEELLKLMTPAQLETKTTGGDTALSVAARGNNNLEIVQLMATKNPYLLQIENKDDHSPLAMAAIDGDENVLRHLYRETPETMFWKTGDAGKRIATLLTSAARVDAFDVVLDLLHKLKHKQSQTYVLSRDAYGMNLLSVLAKKPCAFPSGNKFGPFRRYVYRLAGVKEVLDCKVKHDRTLKILGLICSELPSFSPNQLKESLVHDAIVLATIHGITEMFEKLINTNPYLEHYMDQKSGRGLFQIAIMSRQEEIYGIMSQMGQRNQNISLEDKSKNNTLHYAGFWKPSPQLDKAHGPALQMQREIQWFLEIERVVPPRYRDMENANGLTPKALFTHKHKELARDGEKWMKDTAKACMLVTTLIATVMFAAAFTLPGGNDQTTGIPLYLKSRAFKIFIVSDAVSLFASCTSVLMFFSILTARFVERDFLKSLPRKLILGLSTLFVSIATMMITFGTTLVIVLRGEASWVYIPVSILAAIPVILFGFLQLPLFYHIVSSTHGRGIFRKRTLVLSPLTGISYGE